MIVNNNYKIRNKYKAYLRIKRITNGEIYKSIGLNVLTPDNIQKKKEEAMRNLNLKIFFVDDSELKVLMDFVCDICGVKFNIFNAGYIGPKDRNSDGCNPSEKYEYLCNNCEKIKMK